MAADRVRVQDTEAAIADQPESLTTWQTHRQKERVTSERSVSIRKSLWSNQGNVN